MVHKRAQYIKAALNFFDQLFIRLSLGSMICIKIDKI